MPLTIWAVVVMVFLCIHKADGQEKQERIERLVALCKLWTTVKYFHPFLAYRQDIDWDKALADAIPKVNSTADASSYAAAVGAMLAELHDPATQVVQTKVPPVIDPRTLNRGSDPQYTTTSDGVLLVRIAHYYDLTDWDGMEKKAEAIKEQIDKSRAIVIDLRSPAPVSVEAREAFIDFFQILGPRFIATPVSAPGERRRMHRGFAPYSRLYASNYKSGFYVLDGERVRPGEKAKELPTVFLVNMNSALPPIAIALQAAGKGVIVAEGGTSDASVVSVQQISLTEGFAANIRLGELVYPDNGGFAADATVLSSSISGEDNPALKTALELARNFKPSSARRLPFPDPRPPVFEKSYSETNYPAQEYRLLGAFRLWAAINYFYPYRELIEEDWDFVLREAIPRFEQAANALEYAQAIAEMVTHIHDSHGIIASQALNEYFGAATVPFLVRMIEGDPVITGFVDQTAAEAAGLEIGDAILKVDGEEAAARMARLAKYIASSTPQTLAVVSANRMLRGPDQSTADLVIRDRNNVIRHQKIMRSTSYRRSPAAGGRTGDIIRVLGGNIGYVDLDRLTMQMVDEMFEKLNDTKAIIFDLRGYPQGTVLAIARRLTNKTDVPVALFQTRVAMNPDSADGEILSQSTTHTFMQRLPASTGWQYRGKTVMLMDERTVSQAEHAGLNLKAANNTTFVGSPTVGANGTATDVVLPGGISVTFTGQAVKHPDGRQLQRLGLQPDIPVTPTISAIRAGRDEVLEKALEYLNGPEWP